MSINKFNAPDADDICESAEKKWEITVHLIQALNASDNHRDLMKSVTGLLRDWTKCEAIGIRLRDGEDYTYFETSGFPASFLEKENHLCVYDLQGQIIRDSEGSPVLECMCGNILRRRFDPSKPFFTAHGSFWTNSTSKLLAETTNADRQSRTRNRCNGEGYESVALIPLRTANQVFGLLQLNDHRPNQFSPQRIALFEQLADSIAMALSQRQLQKALRESEALLSKSQEIAHIGSWDLDIISNRLTWSEEVYRIFGLHPNEFAATYETFLDSIHPEDRDDVDAAFKGSLRDGSDDFEIDHRVVRKDTAEIRVVHEKCMHQRDKMGWIVRSVGMVQDITEYKRVEEALNESKQRLELAYRAAGAGTWDWDMTCQRLDWSKELYTMLGLNPDKTVATLDTWTHVIHPDDRANATNRLEQAIKEKTPLINDYRIILPDGQMRWISALGNTTYNPSGQPLRMTGICIDITERKRVEDALRESEERFRGYFDLGLIGMAVTSPEKGWLLINNRLCEILGYSHDELMQKTWAELTHPEDFPLDEAQFNKVLRGEMDGYSLAKRFIRANGSAVDTELSVHCVRRADGSVRHFVAMIQDISERKLLEDKLRQSQKLESIGQLAGGVAHDFNNIMAATMMQLGFLQRNTSLDQEARDMVKELMADAKRAANLTAQLLMFSRRSVLENKVLDLKEVVTNLLKMLERLIGEQINIRFDWHTALPAVEADARMVEQVVMNLTLNARDAMPKGGLLTIKLECFQVDAEQLRENVKVLPGQFVCLSVSDTGCGMDEDTLNHLFEPFFTTKEVGKGTGLGLAVVHGIMAQHKGWVDVESELGKGTTFKVFFPAKTNGIVDSNQKTKPTVIRGHETILLVEDEVGLRKLVARGLQQLGYRVLVADNGQTALKLWQEQGQQIDLLFSDMVMPAGMSGAELAEILIKEKPNLKAIISSGYNLEMAGQETSPSSSIMYFHKPYEFEALSQTIRACLDRA